MLEKIKVTYGDAANEDVNRLKSFHKYFGLPLEVKLEAAVRSVFFRQKIPIRDLARLYRKKGFEVKVLALR
ncbi:hypothetical protein AB2B41_21935 [Marimonas sp. MJW-29]|uniref:Uncharacterized protein n=1 Tax=Sulfitobacter sediminis TaxID=3234186 RepID=A0ABV3RTD4_9RHOB